MGRSLRLLSANPKKVGCVTLSLRDQVPKRFMAC